MLKKIIIGILIILVTSFILCIEIDSIPASSAIELPTEEPSQEPTEAATEEPTEEFIFIDYQYEPYLPKEEIEKRIEEIEKYIILLSSTFGEAETEKINNLFSIIDKYKKDLSHWAEYPVATKVWNFMKTELEWSDTVCAGVMGNLMAETCYGGSMNIQWNIWNPTHEFYGICQWYTEYFPELADSDLDFQLNFIKETVPDIFNTYGNLYQKGFRYKDFMALESAEQVALAFAKTYERCHSNYYNIRMEYALVAYEYYSSGTRE